MGFARSMICPAPPGAGPTRAPEETDAKQDAFAVGPISKTGTASPVKLAGPMVIPSTKPVDVAHGSTKIPVVDAPPNVTTRNAPRVSPAAKDLTSPYRDALCAILYVLWFVLSGVRRARVTRPAYPVS